MRSDQEKGSERFCAGGRSVWPPTGRAKSRSDPFSGLTLVEVLLTLALLVVLSAMAWPTLNRPWASQRLRRAADQVRADWTRARVKAMSTGQTHIFRYAPEEGRYEIRASGDEELMLGDVVVGASGEAFGVGDAAPSQAIQRNLPEGVTFLVGDSAIDTRAVWASETELLAFGPDLMQADAPECADVIRFYPDGTTSTARLLLKNEHDRVIELVLRGLTGVVTVGEVKALGEQVPP